MSVNLGSYGANNTAVKQFDTEVKQAYQAQTSVLDGSYRARLGVVGDTYNFRKMTAIQAIKRNTIQTNVTPANADYSLVTCSLANYDCSDYTDIFAQTEVNFSERQELATAIGGAMARRRDQNLFDAIIAGGTAGYGGSGQSVASTVGGTSGASVNLNVAKLLAAKKFLDTKNVPKADRYILMHANQAASLLTDPLFINRDYNGAGNFGSGQLMDGDPKFYLGFKFVIIGDYTEGGVPLRTANRYAYVWHKMAVGAAFANVQETEVNYIPEKKSWLASGNLRMGAAVIEDQTGLVRIDCVDAAGYTTA